MALRCETPMYMMHLAAQCHWSPLSSNVRPHNSNQMRRSLLPIAVLFAFAGVFLGCAQAAQDLGWNDPLEPAVVTTQDIAEGKLPVLRVRREAGPGGWQMYDNTNIVGKKPVAIAKTEALKRDPSLREITHLLIGWEAERAKVGAPWVKRRIQ